MVYRDIYIYTEHYNNFTRGFKIVKKVFDSLPSNVQLNGVNFNRYVKEGEDNELHMTVRFDLEKEEVPQAVMEVLNSMEGQDITRWQIENPLVKPMREYPKNTHIAHETSTACALAFYDLVKQKPDLLQLLQNINRRSIEFVKTFLILLLNKCGFRHTEIVYQMSDEQKDLLNQISDSCAESFKNTIKPQNVTNPLEFTAKFIHLVLNCINFPIDQLLITSF